MTSYNLNSEWNYRQHPISEHFSEIQQLKAWEVSVTELPPQSLPWGTPAATDAWKAPVLRTSELVCDRHLEQALARLVGAGESLCSCLHRRDYHGPALGCSFLQTQVTPGRALHMPTCLITAGDGRVTGPGPGSWHSLVMLILTGKWVPCLEKKGKGTEESCIPSELEDWCSSAKPNISTFKNPQEPPRLRGLSRFSYC